MSLTDRITEITRTCAPISEFSNDKVRKRVLKMFILLAGESRYANFNGSYCNEIYSSFYVCSPNLTNLSQFVLVFILRGYFYVPLFPSVCPFWRASVYLKVVCPMASFQINECSIGFALYLKTVLHWAIFNSQNCEQCFLFL